MLELHTFMYCISFLALFDLTSKQGWLVYGAGSVCACSSLCGFLRVLFYAVYSSKLESDIVALLLVATHTRRG